MKRQSTPLADFIDANKSLIIKTWEKLVVERLGFHLDKSELLNDLPHFIDDLIEALQHSSEQWPDLDHARAHGEHRLRHGIDIGVLTEEMALITEAVFQTATEQAYKLMMEEVIYLSRAIGRGTAVSVKAYGVMRDQELAEQAGKHFSFVAHELRTPLQTASMVAELLEYDNIPDKDDLLRRLNRSLSQVAELVDNVLIQVRLDAQADVNGEIFAMKKFLETVCDDIEPHAQTKSLRLKKEIEEIEIKGDKKLLASALTNLLKNAVKFTDNGKQIIIKARTEKDRVLIEVADQCGGMPDDLPPRLFNPYMQGDDDRSGFGLGLMIVKQAVEAHLGSVSINNRPGDGCSFLIELPITLAADDE